MLENHAASGQLCCSKVMLQCFENIDLSCRYRYVKLYRICRLDMAALMSFVRYIVTPNFCYCGSILLAYRKSYMSFRLVPRSVTLNDPERRNGRCIALFHLLW